MALMEICVFDKKLRSFHFHVKELLFNLSQLKCYFPTAVGLKCIIDKEFIFLEKTNDFLKIFPNITEYYLLTEEDISPRSEPKLPIVEIIKNYFYSRLTYNEISHMIQKEHKVKVSVRTIQRIVRKFNLKRKHIIESPVEMIVAAVLSEIEDSGMNLGYRSLWQRLRNNYKLNVKQKTVIRIMNIVDPEGVESRSRYRLQRRKYSVLGPNYLWHIDGFDKLKRFGFAVHGCVDGFSRKVIWLHVCTSNNKPEIIAYYYLKTIEELKFVPSIIRSDRGTENTILDLLQMVFRHNHSDVNARENSFIKDKSTANERIEKYWRQLRNHTLQFYISLFKTMVNENILDIGNALHVEFLRFCFGGLIQNDLKNSKKEWNRHRLHKQKKVINLPCGIPEVIYNWPERYNGHDCKYKINERVISQLIDVYAQKPILFNSYTEELVNILLLNVETPCNSKAAYDLFVTLIEMVDLQISK